MTIPRAQPLGWGTNQVLNSGEMNVLDIGVTGALDGINGGVYTMGTAARGDGYFRLNSQASTAVPAGPTALMHLQPPNVANLGGLWVELVDPIGVDQPMIKASTTANMASGGVDGGDFNAGGTGNGVEGQGGNGTGAADSKGGQGGQFSGGNGAHGAFIEGGESQATTLVAGTGARIVGGDYNAGNWTGSAWDMNDLPNGIRVDGGPSDDALEEITFTGDVFGTFTLSSPGPGIFSTGGTSETTGSRGGPGGVFLGEDGLSGGTISAAARVGGMGVLGLGGEGDTGSSGPGVAGLGGRLDVGGGRAAGSQAGAGGQFVGGPADGNGGTNFNVAGHGVTGTGAANSGPDPEDKSGDGGRFIAGLATGADAVDGGDGNGIYCAPSHLGIGLVKANGADFDVYGASIYARAVNVISAKANAMAVVAIAKSRGSANVGINAIASVDNTAADTGQAIALLAQLPTAAGVLSGSSCAIQATVTENNTPAPALRLTIPATPSRGHIFASTPTNFPTGSDYGSLFFSQAIEAGMEGSLFLGRGATIGWSRIVDEATPWLVRAWGTIRSDNGTEVIHDHIGVASAVTGGTGITVTFDFDFDNALYPIVVMEDLTLGNPTGAPVIDASVTTKLTDRFVLRFRTPGTAVFRSDLLTLDYGFAFHAVGKIDSIF